LRTASVAIRNVFHGFVDRCWLPDRAAAVLPIAIIRRRAQAMPAPGCACVSWRLVVKKL
jgi:hypothetical protein